MLAAVEEVQAMPHYESDGEANNKCRCLCMCTFILVTFQWVITDARHDSTANAYHTTVPCLSGRFDSTHTYSCNSYVFSSHMCSTVPIRL